MPAVVTSTNWDQVPSPPVWIWNERRPDDIPKMDAMRVVVLDPPPYPRAWTARRPYRSCGRPSPSTVRCPPHAHERQDRQVAGEVEAARPGSPALPRHAGLDVKSWRTRWGLRG